MTYYSENYASIIGTGLGSIEGHTLFYSLAVFEWISRLTVVSREAKKHKACAHNNKHATTTVSHLHEESIMQSFKIRMAKCQPY